MILVDANVLMYAAGAAHPHKKPSVAFLEEVLSGRVEATLDAEVLQEILHRYQALRRWADGEKVYRLAREIFPEVLPVTAAVMDRTRDLLSFNPEMPARDALHAAVVQIYGLEGICSFDRHFDAFPGCRRIAP